MSRPNILVTRRLPADVEARINATYHADLNGDDQLYDAATLAGRAKGQDGLLVTVTDRIDEKLIKSLPDSIKIISTFSVGFDHIDIAAAAKRGIKVTNTPDVLTNATADIAFLLIIGAARGAAQGEALIRNGTWQAWAPTGMLGTDLAGKKLAILGLGRIGKAVARRAAAFGLETHYHNRHRLPPSEEQALCATYHEAPDSLFRAADILSLHCVSTRQTRAIINRKTLSLLPQGAILINTARGDLVEDDALVEALQTGHLAAAGLDVYNNEPNIDPRYKTLPNTFLLPHLGSATVETRNAMGFRALDNLDAFFAGNPLPDPVT